MCFAELNMLTVQPIAEQPIAFHLLLSHLTGCQESDRRVGKIREREQSQCFFSAQSMGSEGAVYVSVKRLVVGFCHSVKAMIDLKALGSCMHQDFTQEAINTLIHWPSDSAIFCQKYKSCKLQLPPHPLAFSFSIILRMLAI